MKKNTVYSHFCKAEDINPPRKEILRYMYCKDENENEAKLIDELLPLVKKVASPKGSFAFFELVKDEISIYINGECLKSLSLFKNLRLCNMAIIFSLSLGAEIDRMITKYSVSRPSAALCINAVATAMIEEYAKIFCEEMKDLLKKENLFLRPRFSPGYADFDLKEQSIFIKLTNAQKLCGINLTDGFMMTPSKSITAIMGASEKNLFCANSGCEMCDKKNCEFRR